MNYSQHWTLKSILHLQDNEARRALLGVLYPQATSLADRLIAGEEKSSNVAVTELEYAVACMEPGQVKKILTEEIRPRARTIGNKWGIEIPKLNTTTKSRSLPPADVERHLASLATSAALVETREARRLHHKKLGALWQQNGPVETLKTTVKLVTQPGLENDEKSFLIDAVCTRWLIRRRNNEGQKYCEKLWCELWTGKQTIKAPEDATSLAAYLRDTNIKFAKTTALNENAVRNLKWESIDGGVVVARSCEIAFTATAQQELEKELEDSGVPSFGQIAILARPNKTLTEQFLVNALETIASSRPPCALSPLRHARNGFWEKLQELATSEKHKNLKPALAFLMSRHAPECTCGAMLAAKMSSSHIDYSARLQEGLPEKPYLQWLEALRPTIRRNYLDGCGAGNMVRMFPNLSDHVRQDFAERTPGAAKELCQAVNIHTVGWMWHWFYLQLKKSPQALPFVKPLLGEPTLTMRKIVNVAQACAATHLATGLEDGLEK